MLLEDLSTQTFHSDNVLAVYGPRVSGGEKMILVIGGRSKIGSALLHELASRGEPTRALTRSHEVGAAFPDRVESVVGDLGESASLRDAMEGVDRVFLLCGPTPNEVEFNQHAIDVAREMGVALLVRSSILGADPLSEATFGRDHGICDEYLRSSGVPHVIVRPNLFLQNVPETTIPSIGADGRFYLNAGTARISMVDTRDVAAVAAAVLTGSGEVGVTCEVTGPEALSYGDVAARLATALGKEVTYVDTPDSSARTALAGFGLSEWMVGALVDLYQDYRRSGTNGYAAAVTDTVARLAGHPARSLDNLLSDQR